MEIIEMRKIDLEKYVELFVSVFNTEPWNDSWTEETARIRIKNMMDTNTFIGKALIDNDNIIGMIWGQKEQYFDGIHFQIQEFCVRTNIQGKGYGTVLLDALKTSLKNDNISNIYLITSKGERTEGFYQKKGFQTSDYIIVMSQRL